MSSRWFAAGVQAGVEGQQHLPDSFQVARATGSEAPQSVYVNRELDLDVWQLADKVVAKFLVHAAACSLLHSCICSCRGGPEQARMLVDAPLLVTDMLLYACLCCVSIREHSFLSR